MQSTVFLLLLFVWIDDIKTAYSVDPESIVEPVNIDSFDHAHVQEDGVKIWRFDIEAHRCGSARVNLKSFVMNLGDYVVVYGLDADGRAIGVERFEGKGWRNEGEVNSRRVWARHIVLELHTTSPSSHFHFTYVHYADCYHEGVSKPNTLCSNGAGWKNMACFANDSSIYNLGPSVLAARFVDGGIPDTCTVWKSGSEGRFTTCHHCFPSQAVVNTAELFYRYDTTTCNGTNSSIAATYHGDRLLKTDDFFDYTVFSVRENTTHISCLRRTTTIPSTNDSIFLIHHPNGNPKKVSYQSNADAGGYCLIQLNSTCVNNETVCYSCDTQSSSSGAPVFYTRNGVKVVFALHFGNAQATPRCPNHGKKMYFIANQGELGSCP
ncbi:uncharacterized protein LOC134188070 [Corticium candelabrum]|uniref:uncharacterized protein LOC134188070 n=1 Tax=Corticium candelabrum TaxID=121492 RepID=UPI002E265B11|nr:uncharacterized protein LOC134188070 [Corticium candelabrum]